jgi:hypothetical protein
LAEGKGVMDGFEPPLPPEAMQVARNWLRLTPEVRSRVADMLDEMVKTSAAEKDAAPDRRVEETYGRPSKKSHDKNKK